VIDYRIQTFLQLCETMNYRVTAELLNMTQPAVTQHIHYLENEFGCKLFEYNGRTLKKTEKARILERYARAMQYQQQELLQVLHGQPALELHIGATKTIGEFVIEPFVKRYLDGSGTLSLFVDNTEVLLQMLDTNQVDFALIEGFFDKRYYDYKLFRKEPFVGICSRSHPFAGRSVGIEELFGETLILREKGSGTRAIFEQTLHDYSYSADQFRKVACISNFRMIQELVADGAGISFVYEAVAKSTTRLTTFCLRDIPIVREFNYVYLKGTNAGEKIKLFEG
jgi:DNA-binding transcriptional LysR family regulator